MITKFKVPIVLCVIIMIGALIDVSIVYIDLPTDSTSEAPRTALGQVSVVFGGISLDVQDVFSSVEVITPTNLCSPLPPLPHAVYSAAAVYVDTTQEIVLCGGSDDDNNILSSCHSLSLHNYSWSPLPHTQPQPSLTFAPELNILVAIGGTTKTVETLSFDGPIRTWVSRPEWSITTLDTLDHCIFYVFPFLYILNAKDLFRLNLSSKSSSWQNMAPMPEAKFEPACVLVDDMFYVVGGQRKNTAVAYNVLEDRWENIPALIQARYASGLGTIGGILTVFGGFVANTTHSDFEHLNSTRLHLSSSIIQNIFFYSQMGIRDKTFCSTKSLLCLCQCTIRCPCMHCHIIPWNKVQYFTISIQSILTIKGMSNLFFFECLSFCIVLCATHMDMTNDYKCLMEMDTL